MSESTNTELTVEVFSIKPLEWEWLEPTRFSSEGHWAAKTFCDVRYLVTCNLKGTFWWQSSASEPIQCASPEEGKHLAEQHWQEYIKQALVPAEKQQ